MCITPITIIISIIARTAWSPMKSLAFDAPKSLEDCGSKEGEERSTPTAFSHVFAVEVVVDSTDNIILASPVVLLGQ